MSLCCCDTLFSCQQELVFLPMYQVSLFKYSPQESRTSTEFQIDLPNRTDVAENAFQACNRSAGNPELDTFCKTAGLKKCSSEHCFKLHVGSLLCCFPPSEKIFTCCINFLKLKDFNELVILVANRGRKTENGLTRIRKKNEKTKDQRTCNPFLIQSGPNPAAQSVWQHP